VDLREKLVGLTRNETAAPPASGLTEQGKLYQGYGDGMSRALEFALTPAIFCGLGYLLDRWLGVVPVFSIVLFLVAVAGMFAKTWYIYEARMRLEDAAAPWGQAGE
jgi:F0F1-type ATP synthase assembly protein I